MKHFLLVLAFCLLASPALAGPSQKWQHSTINFSGTKPSGTTWTIRYFWGPSGAQQPLFSGDALTGGQWGNNTVTNQLKSGRTSTNSTTIDWGRLEIGYYQTLVWHGVMWFQLQPFGGGEPQKSGPIVDGVRQDGAGNPVDDNGDPEEPTEPQPDRYKVHLTHTNSREFPVSITVMMNATPGGFIGSAGPFNVQPGEAWEQTFYYQSPFKATMTIHRDGYPIETPPDVESAPTDESDPERPPDGEPGGIGGPVQNGGGGSTPGNSQVPEADAPPDETRPGDSEGNAESRHKEIKGHLAAMLQQLKNNANHAAKDSDLINGTLGKISDKIGDLKDGLSGGAGPSLNGAEEAEHETGHLDALGLGANLGELRAGAGAIKDSIVGLKNSLGLSPVGTGTLSWNVSIPPFGSFELNIAQALGDWAGIIRQFLLFIMTWYFISGLFQRLQSLF